MSCWKQAGDSDAAKETTPLVAPSAAAPDAHREGYRTDESSEADRGDAGKSKTTKSTKYSSKRGKDKKGKKKDDAVGASESVELQPAAGESREGNVNENRGGSERRRPDSRKGSFLERGLSKIRRKHKPASDASDPTSADSDN